MKKVYRDWCWTMVFIAGISLIGRLLPAQDAPPGVIRPGAANNAAPKDAAENNAEKKLEMPDLNYSSAPLEIVLKDYSRITGRTLLYSPGVLPGPTITLEYKPMVHKELNPQEALEAIETVLSMNNIALIREGDKFLRVVKSDTAREEPMQIVEQVPGELEEPLADSSELISKMITLKHIDFAEAQKAIQPLMHKYGKIATFERINGLLTTDTAANINRIQQVLNYIDQPIPSREEPTVIQIQYAKASDIKKKLEEIIAESQKQTQTKKSVSLPKSAGKPSMVPKSIPGVIRAPITKTTTPEDIETLVEQAERGIIRGEVKIVADERTNVLIIITRPENIKFFEKIIKVLDIPTQPDVIVRIIRLEYADAEELEATLNSLIGNKSSSSKDANTVPGAKPGTARERAEAATLREYVRNLDRDSNVGSEKSSVGELSAENIKILSDKRTNSLLIMARPSDFEAIKEIITRMDTMLSQVMIEVVIIQVDLDDKVSSGMHWVQRALIATDKDGAEKGAFAGSGGSGSGDLMPSLQSPTSMTSLGNWGGASGLTAYFTYFGLNLDMIVRIVSTDTRTKILSSPGVTTTDNTTAKLTSNQQKYFLTGSTVDQWGNVRPQTEIKDIGLTLEVTPRINKNRNVMLEIKQEVSDPGADQTIEGQGSWPTTTKRSFEAAIAVRDRETIILGGLVRNYKKRDETKIPLLGDIPLAGRLFKYSSDNETRAEVVVFVTPYVLDTPEEIAEESARRKDSLNTKDMWKKGWSNSKLATDPEAEDAEDDEDENTVKKIKPLILMEEPGSAPKGPIAPVPDQAAVIQPGNDLDELERAMREPPSLKAETGPDGDEIMEFIRTREQKWSESIKKADRYIEIQEKSVRKGG